MRAMRPKNGTATAMILTLGLCGTAATADHERNRKRPDADIDSLRADIWYGRGGWLLRVRYEIEIEDFRPGERYELVIRLTERGCKLVDRKGRPIEIVVPLDRPTEVDDDELEFEGVLTVRLPARVLSNPKRLRIHAAVVPEGGVRPLDRKDRSVRYRSRWPRRCHTR